MGKTQPKKPRQRKLRKGEDPHVRAVADLAPMLAQTLYDHWPDCNEGDLRDGGYAMLRGFVIELSYSEFARAYGLRARQVEMGADIFLQSACARVRLMLRELPLAQMLPEHFGHIHETLTGYKLVDGKVVPGNGRRRMGAHFTPPDLAMKVTRRTVEPLLECIGEQGPLVLRICDPAVGAGAFPIALCRMLGPLVHERGEATSLDHAKRLVAIQCVRGVDKDRYGVYACKLALRLECRADSMPYDWLDDNIKHGDSLVGLSKEQLEAFHWKGSGEASEAIRKVFREGIAAVVESRNARVQELTKQARAS